MEREIVYIVAVKGELEHQRIQIAVLAQTEEEARDLACFKATVLYGWPAGPEDATIVTQEGKPIKPWEMTHTPERVVAV